MSEEMDRAHTYEVEVQCDKARETVLMLNDRITTLIRLVREEKRARGVEVLARDVRNNSTALWGEWMAALDVLIAAESAVDRWLAEHGEEA